jgi:hypothetical protein
MTTTYHIYARESTRHAWKVFGNGLDYLDTLCRAVPLIVDVKASWPAGEVAIGAMSDNENRNNLPRSTKLDVLYPGHSLVGPNGRVDDCDSMPWRDDPTFAESELDGLDTADRNPWDKAENS